jgi:alkylated DNA repair dioxygenase AlkB
MPRAHSKHQFTDHATGELFAGTSTASACRSIDLPDASIDFYPHFFSPRESDRYLSDLLANTHWKQEQIKWYGKMIDLPRLTAWYGDAGKSYTYSGIRVVSEPWTPTLLEIKTALELVSGINFNSVLLNLYRTGKDSVAWHSDDEKELGENPIIGSLSFGEGRTFQFRHKKKPTLQAKLDLTHGSYLLMKGATQHHWQHQIGKVTRPCGPRINLTFRRIV